MIHFQNGSAKTNQVKPEVAKALMDLLSRKDLGFFKVHEQDSLWKQVEVRAKQVSAANDLLVVFGIGGSSLGGRAIQTALGSSSKKEVLFCENVDPRSFWRALEKIDNPSKTHFAVVSKSGTTMETLAQLQFAIEHFKNLRIDITKNCTVLTERKPSPLFNWAQKMDCPVLEIPLNVGGRFSVLSPVGMFPAAFLGLSLSEFKKGAESAIQSKELVMQLSQEILNSFERKEWLTYFWSYSDSLKDLGLWVQQLWAESLAKAKDRSGGKAPRASVPVPLVGANDQHSVLQQLMEGDAQKSVWFLGVKDTPSIGAKLEKNIFEGMDYLEGKRLGEVLEAEMKATSLALHNTGCSTFNLSLEKLDEFHLAEVFMVMELVIGTIGEVLNINAFDQPGVEHGKKLAHKILMN